MVERYRPSKPKRVRKSSRKYWEEDGEDMGQFGWQEILIAYLVEEYRYGNSLCRLYTDLLIAAMGEQDPALKDYAFYWSYHQLKHQPVRRSNATKTSAH